MSFRGLGEEASGAAPLQEIWLRSRTGGSDQSCPWLCKETCLKGSLRGSIDIDVDVEADGDID